MCHLIPSIIIVINTQHTFFSQYIIVVVFEGTTGFRLPTNVSNITVSLFGEVLGGDTHVIEVVVSFSLD